MKSYGAVSSSPLLVWQHNSAFFVKFLDIRVGPPVVYEGMSETKGVCTAARTVGAFPPTCSSDCMSWLEAVRHPLICPLTAYACFYACSHTC